jgi:hypothetical protein
MASWGFDPDAWAKRRRSEADRWPTSDASARKRRDHTDRRRSIGAFVEERWDENGRLAELMRQSNSITIS